MDQWRTVFRSYVAPCLSRSALSGLRQALQEDSPRLIVGANTRPTYDSLYSSVPCTGACPLAYAVAYDDELDFVGETHEAFQGLLARVAAKAGSKVAAKALLDWIDDGPWKEVRRELAQECDLALLTLNHLPAEEMAAAPESA